MMKHVLPDTMSGEKRCTRIHRVVLVCAVLLCLFCSISTVSAADSPRIVVEGPDLVKIGEPVTIPVVYYNIDSVHAFTIEVPNNVEGVEITVNETMMPLNPGTYYINNKQDDSRWAVFTSPGPTTYEKTPIFYLDLVFSEDAEDSSTITVKPETIEQYPDNDDITSSVAIVPAHIAVAKPPVIGKPTVENVTYSSATVIFDVSANPAVTEVKALLTGGSEFTAVGNAGTQLYTAELAGLEPETEYTVAGWAVNDVDEIIGESVTFTTEYKPEVTTILLSGEPEQMIRINDTGTLTAEVLDQKGAPMPLPIGVNWTSSSTSVLSINASGKFEALAKGTATLKAELWGKFNETSAITVIGTPSVVITAPVSETFYTDEEISFTAVTTDFGDDVSVSWDFDEETSSESGESVMHTYTAAGSYTVTVTATGTDHLGKDETKTDAVTLTIKRPDAYPKWLVINGTPEMQPIPFGTNGELTAVVYNQYDEIMFGEPVVWSSDNPNALIINQTTGMYKGVGEGTANVTAMAGDPAHSSVNMTTIRVAAEIMVPQSVFIATPGNGAKVEFDETGPVKADVLDQHGNPMSDEAVTWSSDNELIISIDSVNRTYTAHRVAGTVNLTATSVNNSTLSASVLVENIRPTPIATSLTITGTPEGDVEFNTTGVLKAIIYDQFDAAMETPVRWNSSNVTVVTIDENTGSYKGVGAGTVIITATAGTATDKTSITVKPEVLVPAYVEITAPAGGSTIQFDEKGIASAKILDQHKVPMSGEGVTWTSDNESVIHIDSDGNYTAQRVAGTANLTATSVTDGNISAFVTLTNVRPAPIASYISINNLPDTVEAGYNATLNATVYDQFEEIMTSQNVSWSSNNTAVLDIIKETGFLRAMDAGTANVTVSLAENTNITATRVVTVTKQESTASVVAVIPSAMTLSVGDVYQFSPGNTIVYDQYGSRILNPELVWSSSETSVATLSGSLLSAVGMGTTTVTAASGNASGTTLVTVNAQETGNIYVFGPTKTDVEHGGVFTALVLSTTGVEMKNADVIWTSNSPAIRILDDKTGRYYVQTVSEDTYVTITASSGGVTGTKTILVKAPESTAKVIDNLIRVPESADLTAGQSATFVALPVNTTFGVILDASYSWTTSDSDVASVTGAEMIGMITTTSPGSADIGVTARSGEYEKSGTISVTVS